MISVEWCLYRFIAERVPDLDFLALTFTRSGQDVQEARSLLDELGLHHVKILAKVGSPAMPGTPCELGLCSCLSRHCAEHIAAQGFGEAQVTGGASVGRQHSSSTYCENSTSVKQSSSKPNCSRNLHLQ